MSATTPVGCQNAPTRFFPPAGQAAAERGGHESGQIADDAAPDGDDVRPAVHGPLGKGVPQAAGLGDRLRALARRHDQGGDLDTGGL
jgi:hypothetical protein